MLKLILHAVLSPTISHSIFFPAVEYSKKQVVLWAYHHTAAYIFTALMLVKSVHNTKPRKKAVETLTRARGIASELLSTFHQYKIIMTNYLSFQKYCNTYLMNQNKFGISNLSQSWCYD